MPASRKIFKGLLHTLLGSYTGKAVNFTATILLTRTLLPEDFGIVAMALFLASSAGIVKEFGFDFALIHRQTDTQKAASAHFLLSAVTAAFALVVTAVLFFILRGRYEPRILLAMTALAAIFTLRSFSTTSRVMLEKDLRFSLLAWIDTTSNIITLVVAVVLALLGFGFWSLVIAGSVNSLTFVVITSIRYWSGHPLSFREKADKETVRWFFSYGKWMILGALGTTIVLQYDSFMAGTLLGVATLGFYERAYRFSQYPTDSITHVISRMALSIYAKYQDDKVELSRYFSLFFSMIVRVAFPLCAVIYIFAGEIIDVLFGPRWAPMVSPLRWLLVYSLLRPVFDDTGAFFVAIGKPRIISTILLIQAAVMLFLVPALTYSFGITGTAVSADIVMLIGVVLAYWNISKHIKISYLKVFALPSTCVVIAYLCFFVSNKYIAFHQPIVNLIAGAGLFLLIYSSILLYFERDEIRQLIEIARERGK